MFDNKTKFTAPRARVRRWFLPAIMFPVVGGLAYLLTSELTVGNAPSAESATEAPTTELSKQPLAEPLGEKVDFVVRRNDTLERIFRQLKLSLTDLPGILSVPGVKKIFKQLRPGDKVTVVHEDGVVHAINHRISETEVLSVKRADSGFATEIITTPIEIKTAQASGTITTSLFAAARPAGLSPETILQLANDIFGWEIDFALDIRPGDRFNLIYEKKYRDGQYVGDGRIVAAEFINDGEVHRAVHYTSADGKIDNYFTPDGRSMRRQFLRAPLDFTRVSSNFNPRRRHPILNTIRAHQGVDYSAPTGTVIKAAGEGRVSFVGVKGGYGRTVILEHGGKITTLYAHLSNFASRLRQGQRVNQGETIGYVGSSGAATGPHLHYEYRVSGVHMNPRTVQLPSATPIPAEYLDDFRAKTQAILVQLEQPLQTAALSQR